MHDADSNRAAIAREPRAARSCHPRPGDAHHGRRLLPARASQQGTESGEAREAPGANRVDAHASGERDQRSTRQTKFFGVRDEQCMLWPFSAGNSSISSNNFVTGQVYLESNPPAVGLRQDLSFADTPVR